MIKFAIPLVLLLAGCTTNNTLNPQQPSPRQTTQGAQQVSDPIAIRIAALNGIPQNKGDELRETMTTAGATRKITVENDARKPVKYVIVGDMNAVSQESNTFYTHTWTISDPQGNRLHQYTLTDSQEGGATFPWSDVTDATLRQIAQSSLSTLASWDTSAARR